MAIGQGIKRVEDSPLLRGYGRYLADLHDVPYSELVVIRSLYAHARILGITTEARGLPGGAELVTAGDLAQENRSIPLLVPHPALTAVMPTPLAADEVHYVGEPVAVIVAANRYRAEDAAERVHIEYEPLAPALDPQAPLSPLAHSTMTTNQAAQLEFVVGNPDAWAAAWRDAHAVIRRRLVIPRLSPQPMEGRGVAAHVDGWGRLHVYDSTQSPHTARKILSEMLCLPEDQIHVVAPDVGGAFGAKNRFYPEEFLVPYLARTLGIPIRWVSDRREDLLATYQERGQVHEAALALDRDGRILALASEFWQDNGAYTPFGLVVPFTTAMTLPGPYHVPSAQIRLHVSLTNRVPIAPYRGAGRPQAVYVMERLLDAAASELGMDRAELRRRNLVQPNEMPYRTGLVARNGQPVRYDGGDYPRALETVLEAVDYHHQPRETVDGWKIGIGMASYVEMSALGSYEEASALLGIDGTLVVHTGSASQGQGHATTLAQVAADRFHTALDRVRIVAGDTDRVANGVGTYASRTAVVAGNAVSLAVLELRRKCLGLASKLLEIAPDDLETDAEGVRVRGAAQRGLSYAQLARATTGIHLGHREMTALEEDTRLHVTVRYRPSNLTYAYGSHAAVVAVDPETGAVRILRYAICHDGGTLINPLIVEGQTVGGAVQGLGAALTESVVVDDQGQPLNASYMDYLLPLATETPDFALFHLATPSDTNPEGFKGIGEGGTLPVPAVISSAVEDALGSGVSFLPVTPSRIHAELVRSRRAGLGDRRDQE